MKLGDDRATPGSAFDVWIARKLRREYAGTLLEDVPADLLRLLDDLPTQH